MVDAFIVDRILGESADIIIERCLRQVKTPNAYIEVLAKLGLHPELADPIIRDQVIASLWAWASSSVHPDWVIYFTGDSVPEWVDTSPINDMIRHRFRSSIEVRTTPHTLFEIIDRYGDDIQTIVSFAEDLALIDQDEPLT